MRKQELKEAFSQLHASEELVQEVLSLEMENKKPVNGFKIAKRVAACAAVLAVLLTAMLWPGETGTSDGTRKPALGVQVYAADGLVELGSTGGTPVYAGEENTRPDLGLPDDRNVYVYNSSTGEWELLHKTAEDRPPQFTLIIWTHDYLEDYSPRLSVYRDGTLVDLTDKDSVNFNLSLAGFRDGRQGWDLTCSFEEVTTLEIIVEDENTGTLLLKQIVEVTPAIYKTENIPGEEDGVFKNEGYMLVIKEEYAIEVD